jgi:hypothetical protein
MRRHTGNRMDERPKAVRGSELAGFAVTGWSGGWRRIPGYSLDYRQLCPGPLEICWSAFVVGS